MILDYIQDSVSSSVRTISDVTSDYLGKATHVILQCDPAGTIRYTVSQVTDTPSATNGMRLLAGDRPEMFLMEDFRKMKWIRESADTKLNISLIGGRDV